MIHMTSTRWDTDSFSWHCRCGETHGGYVDRHEARAAGDAHLDEHRTQWTLQEFYEGQWHTVRTETRISAFLHDMLGPHRRLCKDGKPLPEIHEADDRDLFTPEENS